MVEDIIIFDQLRLSESSEIGLARDSNSVLKRVIDNTLSISLFATRLEEYFDKQLRLILHHAQMSKDRTARNDSAWSALVESLIRPLPDEDDASHDQRRDDAKALAASIINGLVLWDW